MATTAAAATATATAATTTDRSKYDEDKLHHTPWVEKYRPKNLDDVASQDHAVKVLKKQISTGNLPHMLFYGPPGTGKTSTILALAKQLYGPNLYKSRVLELNASDERGISIVRQKIKNFAKLTVSNPTEDDLRNYPCPPYKIIILDEADSMTNDAQSALRRTMETYANITRFALVCNYITRIIDPLASRCSKFRFKLLNNENSLNRLKYIAKEENLHLDENGAPDEVLNEVLRISNGDMRKAITYLQSASKLSSSLQLENCKNDMNEDNKGESTPSSRKGDEKDDEEEEKDKGLITKASIRETAGILPDTLILQMVESIKQKNEGILINLVNDIISSGWSVQQLIDQLHDQLVWDDTIDSLKKNQIALTLFDTDKKLNLGTDEHIQLLNLVLQVSGIV
ncbi:Subunit of heteropentameric Replication factor C (RF-C) [Lodderomyces elongisporus]|uniref:Subunit of heteropentameric Replication factor C (RF-C) n=1 Tax=Lodderomyces elongisporus TaxID=36914 RepID=UPI002920F607|nr:Subunit of heteropentameric Replication factor C (RF-C) [Lodderomyces elongisporus]WLF81316.1 Subunit of heteropentameric Replication factor C (RF-C) [Lodderomyces elongisporus]